MLKESTYQTPCGTIHYWSSILSLDTTTLVFLPGLTADHRLFDKQVAYFDGKYNIIVWDAPAHAFSWPFRFDFERMLFSRNDVLVELSKTEQKLLWLLVENRGVTLSRAQLVDRIWIDGAAYVDENALSVTVKRLRDKLKAGDYIKTVYGVGYVWKGPADDCH